MDPVAVLLSALSLAGTALKPVTEPHRQGWLRRPEGVDRPQVRGDPSQSGVNAHLLCGSSRDL
jgi:hypothetical protein